MQPNNHQQRIQLAIWTRQRDWSSIDAMLDQADPSRQQPAAQLLRAELAAFHRYPSDQPWYQLLEQAARANFKPALILTTLYHQWSGHQETAATLQQSIATNTPPSDELLAQLFCDNWYQFEQPTWTSLHHDKVVKVAASSAFASPLLSSLICQSLASQLRPASVVDPTTGQAIAHPIRRNSSAQWLPEQLGWIGKLVEQRLAIAADFDPQRGEVLNLLHYTPGQEYRLHLDSLPKAQLDAENNQGGQRVRTVLLALNQDYSGGHTDFPKLDLSVRLQAGQLLRFNNTEPNGNPAKNSQHTGREVKSGEKWLLSKWVRESNTPYATELAIEA